MAVVDVHESFDQDGSWSSTGEPGSGQSELTRKFTATIDPGTRMTEVLADLRVPQFGGGYPNAPSFACSAVDTNQTSPILVEIKARYTRRSVIGGGGQGDQGPTFAPATVRYNGIKTVEPIDEDINGDPIATVNREPIPGVSRPFTDTAITVTKNLATFNGFNIAAFVDRVNSAAFMGWPAGTLKIDDIQAQQVLGNEDFPSYWEASVTMIGRVPIYTDNDKAWWVRVAHKGYLSKKIVDGVIQPRASEATIEGVKVTRPVYLSVENGTQLDPMDPVEWIEFEVHQSVDFNNLNIFP